MTFYVENETKESFAFDEKQLAETVATAVLASEKCPYEASVNLLITDGEGIREYNRDYRDIDAETDVLSFPAVDYERPSDFSLVKKMPAAYLDQDTGELLLGDIILNADRVRLQAQEYGHSLVREYAFLLTHSLLHLLGYDHMNEAEEKEMFGRQEAVLEGLKITR